MGSAMGPSYACLLVGYHELLFLNSFHGHRPLLFLRYIDDIFGVSSTSVHDICPFIHAISSMDPCLHFTSVISDASVSFLDLIISVSPLRDGLSTDIFWKPTDSHSYLSFTSSHPYRCKTSIPYSQFLHLKRICSSPEVFFSEPCNLLPR